MLMISQKTSIIDVFDMVLNTSVRSFESGIAAETKNSSQNIGMVGVNWQKIKTISETVYHRIAKYAWLISDCVNIAQ